MYQPPTGPSYLICQWFSANLSGDGISRCIILIVDTPTIWSVWTLSVDFHFYKVNRPTPWPFGEIIDENCAIVHIDLWRHNDFVRTAIGVKIPHLNLHKTFMESLLSGLIVSLNMLLYSTLILRRLIFSH